MAIISDILKVFRAMPPTEYTASDGVKFSNVQDLVNHAINLEDTTVTTNAKDDRFMCNGIAKAVKDCCDGCTITATMMTGDISAGTIQALVSGVTTVWHIDGSTLANDLWNDCQNPVDASGNAAKTSVQIATDWAADVRKALTNGSCNWDAITVTVVPKITPPPTIAVVGPGTGAFSSTNDTLTADFIDAFTISVTNGIATGDDSTIATKIGTSVMKFLNSMIVDITGTGTLQGGTGKAQTSGAA